MPAGLPTEEKEDLGLSCIIISIIAIIVGILIIGGILALAFKGLIS